MANLQTVPYNFIGGTYESRSRPVSSQRTVNMYQQANQAGKDQFVLYSFPGQKFISEVIGGKVDRGMHRMSEIQYRVLDDTLYLVNALGEHTAKGTVTGAGRCIFADDGENLVIISDLVYVYNSFTNLFSQNTNVNLVDVLSVTIINNQFIYTTAKFSFMSAPGDPFSVSGLDAVASESSPDDMVRDYVFNQTIYRFGVRTTEPWYNSDSIDLRPPIDRIDGQEFSVGLGAIHSLANTDKALYWLGDDKAIYRVSGNIEQRISDDGLSNTIESMTKTDDAFGFGFTLQGQDFYLITFPTGKRTFVINEELGKSGWFELLSGLNGAAYSGTSLLQVYDKLIIAKKGKLLELVINEYTQDTDTIIRERVGLPITRKIVPRAGIKGRAVFLSRIEFIIEAGVGLMTGQGENPRMLVEFSTDGGRSFAHSQWVEIGRLGEHTLNAQADVEIVADEIIPRITMSDPVPLTISATLVDVKEVRR